MTSPKTAVSLTSAAVDVGQTATRLRLWSGRGQTIDVIGAPSRPLVNKENADDIASVISRTARSTGTEAIDVITIGLTGFYDDHDLTARIASRLSDDLSARRVVIADDVLTGFVGALPGAQGAVVTAGTGAVALAIAPDGTWSKCDGYGSLLGDHGSGYAIGLAAVRAAIRSIDNVDSNGSDLATSLLGEHGSAASLRQAVQNADRPEHIIAGFVPVVAEVARAGDALALSIWRDAAASLAATVTTALKSARHLDRPVVSYVGGVFNAEDLLLHPFCEELSRRIDGVDIVTPDGDPLAGAVRLHDKREPALQGPLLHVYERNGLS